MQERLKILKSEPGISLVEVLLVLALTGIFGIMIYDLNVSILTSNLFLEIKNDLMLHGQQTLNQIKNRLISSRLLLVDLYNKTTGVWIGVGSYYVNPQIMEIPPQYLPLSTVTPGNTDPGGSEYYNVIAQTESRNVTKGGVVTALPITTLAALSASQVATGLSAHSIGNSILFIETLPARRVCHQWGYPDPPTPTTNYRVDTYRLNYYYLRANPSNQILDKDYYVDLIQWESIEFVDYGQLLQILTAIKQTPITATAQAAEDPGDVINQLINPETVAVHSSCIDFFARERSKSSLQYAWDISNAATNIVDSASIRVNFYCLTITSYCSAGYNTSFDPNNNQTTDDVPLNPVSTTFRIPPNKATNLLAGLSTGATQGRTPYSIAFNGAPGDPTLDIPHVVPLRFNPYDTTDFVGGTNGSQFMGGFEIGIITNDNGGHQVNLRLVLMAESGPLRRIITHETVVLATTLD
jgi:hypothetical protein